MCLNVCISLVPDLPLHFFSSILSIITSIFSLRSSRSVISLLLSDCPLVSSTNVNIRFRDGTMVVRYQLPISRLSLLSLLSAFSLLSKTRQMLNNSIYSKFFKFLDCIVLYLPDTLLKSKMQRKQQSLKYLLLD